MKYQHIVFDVDGTLVDTQYAVIHSLQDTLLELFGWHMTEQELTFSLGITGDEVLRRLKIRDMEGTMKRWLEILKPYQSTNHLFEGIPELLQTLKAAGCTLGVVTSRVHKLYDEEMPRMGISHMMDHVVCADDTTEHKPTGAPLRKYMEWTGASPEQVLYIGDSVYDMQCAADAGTDFLLAGWGAVPELRDRAPYAMEPREVLKTVGL